MSEKENKSIVKRESAFLQKVGNQIAITNKLLLRDDFDYLKWWNELNYVWMNLFRATMKIEIALINVEKAFEIEAEQDRVSYLRRSNLLNFEKEIENDYQWSLDTIKYLITLKSIAFGKYVVHDLEPLSIFFELEKLEFTNAEIIKSEITSLKPLKSLKKLKLLDCKGTIVSPAEIELFKKEHPNCKVIS
jgi:hypothetical protein